MEKTENGGFFLGILKSVLSAVIITLIGVLIFAFVIKVAFLGKSVIKAVNQFIKILSIFLGCTFCLRGRAGFIKGVIVGGLTTIITYLLFSFFGVEISFGFGFYVDLIFTIIVGAISGVIAVNLKTK